MTIAQLFRKLFGPVEREAEIVAAHVEADAHSAVQLLEKELAMLSQTITDALARIKAAIEGHAGDAQTISGLQGQVADLTAQGAAKDGQVAALTQQLSDAQAQLAEVEAAVVAAANDAPAPAPAVDPAVAPADGSGSGDVAP